MTLVRYQKNLPNLFDKFFNEEFENWVKNNLRTWGSSIPAVNIREDEDSYVIEVAAPGYKKSDFNIELNDNILSISVEKEESGEKENDNYTRREFNYQSFKRSFSLPEEVDADSITANYKNGILTIKIKKQEEKPKAVKRIEVK